MAHLGDFALSTTIYAKFCTVTTTGAPTQLAGSPVVSVYENDDNTQITSGVTLNVDEDGVTGLNQLVIVASGANGFEAGKFYDAVITTGTVGGTSVVGYCVASFTIEATSALRPTTAARTLDVTAGGNAGVDWANVEAPTTTLALTGTTIATTQKVDVETIKTNPVVNAGTVTFPTTATLASTTNITAGTMTTTTTATNLTNAPTNGDFTSTMKTSIGTAVAASAVASVTGAVGSVASGGIAAASFAAGAINAAAIADGAIDAATFAAGAITATVIADASIDAATFAANAITSTVIADDAITDAKVASDVTIASVTGAVGSVTGAVGSVTGAVGSVTGAVGSVTGAVGSVTGNVGGNVTGSVGSVVGAVGSVTGAVGSVTGAVGSVTGNVGGNVTGSVGSVAASGIAAASFAAGAITASALAADAVDEIFDELIGDSTITMRQALKVLVSGLAGKLSGAATTTITIRNVADDTNRIVATVDADGNRSAVTLSV